MANSSSQNQGVDLVCIGSIVADFVFTGVETLPTSGALVTADGMEIHPGGCATNTSIAFSALGGAAELIARVGVDQLGDAVLRMVGERGVHLEKIIRTDSETATTVVLVSTTGERTFVYYPGANALLAIGDILPAALSSTRIVHLADTFLLAGLDGQGSFAVLREAKAKGRVTSMDTSWDPLGRWLDLIAPHLALVDLFFCSVKEALAMTLRSTVSEAAKVLLDHGPKLVIIKMGEHGSFILTGDSSIHVPALACQVIDTTGAGDCYVAAYLFAFLQEWDYERCAQFASAAGAASVSARGATAGIKSREQVLSLMEDSLGTMGQS